jgi:hypothetical protein
MAENMAVKSTLVASTPGNMNVRRDVPPVEAGYVTRTRDEDDRRRRNLSLTPAGAAATARLDEIAKEAVDVVLAPLGRRERAVLDRLLSKAAFGPRRWKL